MVMATGGPKFVTVGMCMVLEFKEIPFSLLLSINICYISARDGWFLLCDNERSSTDFLYYSIQRMSSGISSIIILVGKESLIPCHFVPTGSSHPITPM